MQIQEIHKNKLVRIEFPILKQNREKLCTK